MRITNFASGELSKNLRGRTDIQQYFQGAQRIKNFEVIPTGGIKRRTGSRRLGELHGECRLISFIIDKDTSFVLEVMPGKIYFWKNGQPYKDQDDQDIYVPNPWTSLYEINEVHYAQNYDTLIFVQRNHAPQILKYDFTLQLFEMAPMSFDFYPDVQLDDDFDYVKIAGTEGLPVADFDGQYCIYNGKLWKWSEADEEWKIEGNDPDIDMELFTTENKYPGAVAFFNSRLFLGSTNQARQKVWASATPDTKGTRYNEFSTYQKYITVTKGIKEPDLHVVTGNILKANIDKLNSRTVITGLTQDFTQDKALAEEVTKYFLYNTTHVPIGTKVIAITPTTMTIDTAIETDADLHAIVFSMSLWRNPEGASADDYEYKITQQNITTPDVSFNFELASDQNDSVLFMASNVSLIIGTEASVWYVPSGVNANNIQAIFNGSYGSDRIQGHCVGNATIYFAQGLQGIREHYFDSQAEAFRTNNIAILAEQMLEESPAVDFDFMTNPYHRLIVTREDGTIAAMLYDKNNGIMAWHRIEHAIGKIMSTSVTRSDGKSDLLFMAVKDMDEKIYLEMIDPRHEVYLDSWKLFSPDDEGNEIYSGGYLYNDRSGSFMPYDDFIANPEGFIAEGDEVYIGYEYESLILSMPVLTNDPTGKKRITKLYVRFVDSFMPEMNCTDLPVEKFASETVPYSGIKGLTYPGYSERDVDFTISMKDPTPCNILAVDAQTA